MYYYGASARDVGCDHYKSGGFTAQVIRRDQSASSNASLCSSILQGFEHSVLRTFHYIVGEIIVGGRKRVFEMS